MASTVIDELITILGFNVQSDDLKKLDRQLKEVDRSVKQTMDRFAKGAAILGTALTGITFTVGRTVLSFDRAMNTLQATFPETWTAEAPEGADYATAVMAAFGSRVSRKISAMPDSEANVKILTGEVLAWTARQFGIDMKENDDG